MFGAVEVNRSFNEKRSSWYDIQSLIKREIYLPSYLFVDFQILTEIFVNNQTVFQCESYSFTIFWRGIMHINYVCLVVSATYFYSSSIIISYSIYAELTLVGDAWNKQVSSMPISPFLCFVLNVFPPFPCHKCAVAPEAYANSQWRSY